jgi:hypothetical protein
MENKQIRKLKVYSQGQGNKWSIPTIILKGEWLEKLGFECGDEIEVICEKDIIKIYKSEKID